MTEFFLLNQGCADTGIHGYHLDTSIRIRPDTGLDTKKKISDSDTGLDTKKKIPDMDTGLDTKRKISGFGYRFGYQTFFF